MTLIELLVTIVILVTVLAAVLPTISPNNDAKRIREGARQLTTMLQQAQAQAARDGRSVGVAIYDSLDPNAYDGTAVEAYFVKQPAPYSGFSEASRVIIGTPNVPLTYGKRDATYNPNGNGGIRFGESRFDSSAIGRNYYAFPIYRLQFIVDVPSRTAGTVDVPDPLPPQTVQIGDEVEVGNYRFLIVDDGDAYSAPNMLDNGDSFSSQAAYLQTTPPNANTPTIVDCVWINQNGNLLAQPIPPLPATGAPIARPVPPSSPWPIYQYRIVRQPLETRNPKEAASRTVAHGTAPPLQFPRGVGVDVADSGARFSAAVIFGPNGKLDSVYVDGTRQVNFDRFSFFVGRSENGHPYDTAAANTDRSQPWLDFNAIDLEEYDFRSVPRDATGDDVLRQRRQQVNLLNPNSKWVTVSRSGRVVTSENVQFDPRLDAFVTGLSGSNQQQNWQQRERQRLRARSQADALVSDGGR